MRSVTTNLKDFPQEMLAGFKIVPRHPDDFVLDLANLEPAVVTTAAKPTNAPHDLAVVPHELAVPIDLPEEAGIQQVFRHLANDQDRTEAIAAAVRESVDEGRKVLVLTERTDHLDVIQAALVGTVPTPFVLHGRMSRKQRASLIAALDALQQDLPRVVLATGKLVGKGFDHPPLDTLVLAIPVSWKGTLQRYAGRLHRPWKSASPRSAGWRSASRACARPFASTPSWNARSPRGAGNAVRAAPTPKVRRPEVAGCRAWLPRGGQEYERWFGQRSNSRGSKADEHRHRNLQRPPNRHCAR